MLFIHFELYKFGLENQEDTLKRIFEVAQTYSLLCYDKLKSYLKANKERNQNNQITNFKT